MPHDLPLVAHGQPGADLTVQQDHGAIVRRSVLPGGTRVVTEHIPGMRSAAIGAWVGVGSRDEAPEHAGSTHFLEHLLFKGTKNRGALEIAESFDRVGGETNALTAKEYTCYYARVLDADARMATAVILDMVTAPLLDVEDFETERGVILEELAMNDDDPADVAHEKFTEAVLGGHPLGRPIGGTPEIIRAVSRDAVHEHYIATYRPATLVVTAAGGVDHDEVCAWVTEALASSGWQAVGDVVPAARRDTEVGVEATLTPEVRVNRDTEQTHILLGTRGFKTTEPRRAALAVYNAILGGGMSSRLFQEVREKRGLAYTTYSFGSPCAETGVFGMYAACASPKADEVEALLVAEMERMASGVTAAELERAIGQLSGATVLRLEDSSSRMSRLGKAELSQGELWSIGEALDEVAGVTVDDVAAIAADIAGRDRVSLRVGPHGNSPVTPGAARH